MPHSHDMTKKILGFATCTLFLSGCALTTTQATLPKGTPLTEIDVVQTERSSHSVYFDDQRIAQYASVPDAVLLSQPVGVFPTGTILTYFNDTAQDERDGQMSFGLTYSVDSGKTWSDRITVPITGGDSTQIAADASIVQLSDGTLRIYFYALNPKGDIGRDRDIYAASSSDGLSFTQEGLVYHTSSQVNNPDVIEHNGQWYLFLTSPETNTAGFSMSSDPLKFETYTEFPMKGILGATSDGEEILLYGCSANITEWTLKDGAAAFKRNTEFTGCDPSPFFDASGALHMIAKKIDKAT